MVIEVRARAGSVQLVSWGEARLVEDSQEDWGQGTLVGVEARADGTLALADPGPPTFDRNSVAYLSDGSRRTFPGDTYLYVDILQDLG